MYKQQQKIAVWMVCATLLGGCNGNWPESLSLAGILGERGDAEDSPRRDDFSGSLAAALNERGIVARSLQASPQTVPLVPPSEPTPQSRQVPPVLPDPTAASPQPRPQPQRRPLQRRRIVSIPLAVADGAHTQGLLRRTALLNGTYGGRIRLLPYGPDPVQATASARSAAGQLLFYGVPRQQVVVDRAIAVSAREARIDVLFEYAADGSFQR